MIALLYNHLRRLRTEQRGATLIEFAMVAPVLMLVVMGVLEMTYRLYATAVLQGEVQKAARDSTLESGVTSLTRLASLDQRVKDGFRNINGRVTDSDFTFIRRNFMTNTDAADAEPASTADFICRSGATFSDVNNNGIQDDGAEDGQGGAGDVTLYSVTVRYRSIFPVNALYGASSNPTITASTILRNQPFTEQRARNVPTQRACP